jgi:predicted RNase H-like HicB family nuclease
MVKVLNFKTILEQDEDGYFVASVPAVPGCYSQGKTYEEALKCIKEALELALEVAKDNPSYAQKISYPEENKRESFLGVIDLPVKLAY